MSLRKSIGGSVYLRGVDMSQEFLVRVDGGFTRADCLESALRNLYHDKKFEVTELGETVHKRGRVRAVSKSSILYRDIYFRFAQGDSVDDVVRKLGCSHRAAQQVKDFMESNPSSAVPSD